MHTKGIEDIEHEQGNSQCHAGKDEENKYGVKAETDADRRCTIFNNQCACDNRECCRDGLREEKCSCTRNEKDKTHAFYYCANKLADIGGDCVACHDCDRCIALKGINRYLSGRTAETIGMILESVMIARADFL
jgi:hypothetical protein